MILIYTGIMAKGEIHNLINVWELTWQAFYCFVYYIGLRNICQTAVTPLNTESQNANLRILDVLQFFAENIFAGTQWYWKDSLGRTGGMLRL